VSLIARVKALESALGLTQPTVRLQGKFSLADDLPVGADLSRLWQVERRGAALALRPNAPVTELAVHAGAQVEQILCGTPTAADFASFNALYSWFRQHWAKTPGAFLRNNTTAWLIPRDCACALDAVLPVFCLRQVAADFLVKSDCVPPQLVAGQREYHNLGPLGFCGIIEVSFH
jgi:hypothetical protein